MLRRAERRAEMEALREECTRMEAQRAELEVKLKTLSMSIATSKTRMSMLAPINILPDDVMVEIIQTAYQHHFPHCRFDEGLYNVNSPVAFAQGCRRWRHLVLSMPSLWTCIHVTRHQGNQYEELVEFYLEWSKGRALSILFVCHTWNAILGTGEFSVVWEDFEDIVTVWPRFCSTWERLLPEAHRWKDCALYSAYIESVITQ